MSSRRWEDGRARERGLSRPFELLLLKHLHQIHLRVAHAGQVRRQDLEVDLFAAPQHHRKAGIIVALKEAQRGRLPVQVGELAGRYGLAGLLPEVVGDAAVLVNPENVFDIARGMKWILSRVTPL